MAGRSFEVCSRPREVEGDVRRCSHKERKDSSKKENHEKYFL